MARVVVGAILSIFFLVLPVTVLADFWASAQSNKYHYPSCHWAKQIKGSNLIVFKTAGDAVRGGYLPCKVCQPPAPRR